MPRLSASERETRLSNADPEGALERREFRQTAAFVVGAHALVLIFFALLSKFQRKPQVEQIQWLDGGIMGGGEAGSVSAPPPEPESPQPPPPPPEPEPELPKPPPEPTSDLAVPKATPPPATPPPATPKPATPKPSTPKPSTPKPKPTTPKPTPKATPKKSASPKPASSPKPSPKASPGAATASPKPVPKEGEGQGESGAAEKAGSGKGASVGEGKGKGTAGTGPGAGKPSDFGWYFSSLRDHYYAVWAPPSVPDAGSLVVTLKIRVKRDGTVLGHELVKSSGNSLMDGSVLAAAEQVPKIDPLPPGLGKEDIVEIPINFKPE
jgi:TonB family protein